MQTSKQFSTVLFTLILCISLTTLHAQEAEEKGDLMLVMQEFVSPENVAEYEQWGKDLKQLAEEDNFRPFFVSSDMESFYYIFNIGKDLAGVDKLDADFGAWAKEQPQVMELYNKYKHTMTHTKRSVWRHSPKYSYSPANYEASGPPAYARFYTGWAKVGHSEDLGKVLDEFKSTWKELGVESPYDVYWNVFGEDDGCVMIRSAYPDARSWLEDRDANMEKVGPVMMELIGKWNKHLRKQDESEGFPRADLSHMPGASSGN